MKITVVELLSVLIYVFDVKQIFEQENHRTFPVRAWTRGPCRADLAVADSPFFARRHPAAV